MNRDIALFLRKAKKTALEKGRTGKIAPSRVNAHEFDFDVGGKFRYYDTCLGSPKFAGQEALWNEGIPFWAMNYNGRILGLEFCEKFLKEALMLLSEDLPLRGPELYQNGDYEYRCRLEGDFNWFSGREEVYFKGKLVYECNFNGGEILD
ncbi:MAG: DUF5680 domain-containing protein [Clostridiales bacterium]|jgi:hypothetical protein|nr:DUF5680 domain-containing protein [Clostridiales bacterium]